MKKAVRNIEGAEWKEKGWWVMDVVRSKDEPTLALPFPLVLVRMAVNFLTSCSDKASVER